MEQHKYTLDTAPAELYQKFMEKFSQDKDVMKLEQKLQDHQRNKDYVQVLKLRQTLQKKKNWPLTSMSTASSMKAAGLISARQTFLQRSRNVCTFCMSLPS